MVAIIVIEAPPILSNISTILEYETTPIIITIHAPIKAGYASFNPLGLINIISNVIKKTIIAVGTVYPVIVKGKAVIT